jgi:hypothetical protein
MRRLIWGWPPAPRWATISCVVLSTSTSDAASEQLYFVWDISKDKSTGSDHRLPYKRYYNLVCVLRRLIWGWPPAQHWATISFVALSTSASDAVSEQIYMVWDISKGKSTGSDHLHALDTLYNLVCVLRRSIWAGRQHNIGPPYCV